MIITAEYGIVINADGAKVRLINTFEPYTLSDGETLVLNDIDTTVGMTKARYIDGTWVDTATSGT